MKLAKKGKLRDSIPFGVQGLGEQNLPLRLGSCFLKKIISLTCLYLGIFALGMAQSPNAGRIESEYKLAVPKNQKQEIWSYLATTYGPQNIQKLDTAFTSILSEEIFYDQYFDNEERILYQNSYGARFRQRFVMDTLNKALFQLKIPMGDSTGVARMEVKFNPYTKIKKSDRKAMHPFWKHIKPKNRDEVNLQLATLNTKGDDLYPTVKVKQNRKRVYISQQDAPLMTMTFDEVSSFYFPYPSFIELELELNEIRYTDADLVERKKMEKLNQKIKEDLLAHFPDLRQDQTPKYNKMTHVLDGNFLRTIYDKLMYIILGMIVLYAVILFMKQNIYIKAKTA